MKRLYVAPVVAFKILKGALQLFSIAAAIYASLYGLKGVEQSKRIDHVFDNGQLISLMETQRHWVKGQVYYGLNQLKGTSAKNGHLYDISYRENNKKWQKKWHNGFLNKNNNYQGLYKLHIANGKSKYSYMIEKKTLKAKGSTLRVDYLVK